MKIGIFGGSFNPIHIGHAILARYVVENCDIDELWFMVTPISPFKDGETDDETDFHRLSMAEMVSCRISRTLTSAFEFELSRPSFTIPTLNALKEEFPDDEFSLIIGADNWAVFPKWKDADEIIANHHIYVYPRRGFDTPVPENLSQQVTLISAPLIEVSSTDIRNRVKNGESIDFLVPKDVNEYIEEYQLYK